MRNAAPTHYETLGLEADCTDAQIRSAYRLLAKQLHPDRNGASPESVQSTQALNAAYAVLGDPTERRRYDQSLKNTHRSPARNSGPRPPLVTQEVQVRIEDLLKGATLEISVNDPGNPDGREIYPLNIPALTAPNTRLRIVRDQNPDGGFLQVKLKASPGFQFKPRGNDLRCDLRIPTERARHGGYATLRSVTGQTLRVEIPAGIKRGAVLRIPGEGLPTTRGGRGDLLVAVRYQPYVDVRRPRSR